MRDHNMSSRDKFFISLVPLEVRMFMLSVLVVGQIYDSGLSRSGETAVRLT